MKKRFVKRIGIIGYFLVACCTFFSVDAFAQINNTDSLEKLISRGIPDSNKVRQLWQLAYAINKNNPEKALLLSQEGLILARKINDTEGQSRSLGVMANTFMMMGNYPRALEFNLKKLKIEENRSNPKNMASVLMNIGAVYIYQEDFRQALAYYKRSDSLIEKEKIQDLKYYVMLNIGDVYDKLNIADSAFLYFNNSLGIAHSLKDTDLIGTSLTGLGHTFRKLDSDALALQHYQQAIRYLTEAQDDDVLCEANLGLAKLYHKLNKTDSAEHFARQSLNIAVKDGFLSRQLEASQFLTQHFQSMQNIDSSYAYLNHVKMLNDSVNSKARIRESQILSSNEQLRQLELEESRKVAAKERSIQLQLLFIGIFIPGFFLLTLLLSRIKIHVRVIKALGILSLLILFEYLTLLLHPYVKEFTHHTPIYEMLIFVSIAAILIPAHHRIEHWLIEKLIAKRSAYSKKMIKLKSIRLKDPEPGDQA